MDLRAARWTIPKRASQRHLAAFLPEGRRRDTAESGLFARLTLVSVCCIIFCHFYFGWSGILLLFRITRPDKSLRSTIVENTKAQQYVIRFDIYSVITAQVFAVPTHTQHTHALAPTTHALANPPTRTHTLAHAHAHTHPRTHTYTTHSHPPPCTRTHTTNFTVRKTTFWKKVTFSLLIYEHFLLILNIIFVIFPGLFIIGLVVTLYPKKLKLELCSQQLCKQKINAL